jgi:hypothetical protein
VIVFNKSCVDERDSIIADDIKLLMSELWRRLNTRIVNIVADRSVNSCLIKCTIGEPYILCFDGYVIVVGVFQGLN